MMAALTEAINVTEHDDDERLTATQENLRRPLEEIVVIFDSADDHHDADDFDDVNDYNDDDLSSISIDCEDDATPAHALCGAATSATPTRPRSIFAKYWDEHPNAAPPVVGGVVVDRPTSPACVLMAPPPTLQYRSAKPTNSKIYNARTYSYLYAGADPYEHFGISRDPENEEEQKVQKGDSFDSSSSSLNTYERMINGEYEWPPSSSSKHQHRLRRSMNDDRNTNLFNVWMSFFGGNTASACASESRAAATTTVMRHSLPSLRNLDRQSAACASSSQRRGGVQSESALLKTPQKSCLRRGRFSVSVTRSSQPLSNNEEEAENTSIRTDKTIVHFEKKVEVFEFQPPVESWAESGWSSWFG